MSCFIDDLPVAAADTVVSAASAGAGGTEVLAGAHGSGDDEEA